MGRLLLIVAAALAVSRSIPQVKGEPQPWAGRVKEGLAYVRRLPLEAAMVVLPFLRPLRLARFLRLARIAVALGVNVDILRSLATQHGTKLHPRR